MKTAGMHLDIPLIFRGFRKDFKMPTSKAGDS